jgi:hypothetical protein
MAAAISDRYALYLLHLLIGVMNEEMNDLMRYGITPIGVGRITPLRTDLREKMLDVFIRMDETVKNAALEMVKDSVSTKDENAALQWMHVMLEELKKRVSSLKGTYGDEMEKVAMMLDEIDEILDQNVEGEGGSSKKEVGDEEK